MKNIFEFKDYKLFLRSVEDSRKSFERGFRSKLAEFIGCQSGYISHVLNGDAQLSLEQGLRVCKFLKIMGKEQKFFLLLIEFARAGDRELKSYFENDLKILLDEHLNIKERVGKSQILSEADQSVYYSSWQYLAVHVLSSLPAYSEIKEIALALKIPESVVAQVLLFLTQAGIIREKNGKLEPGLTQVHLNRESPLIKQHHTNLRISAIQSLMGDDKNDVHYSTLSTLSKEDAEKLRADMVKLIEHYVSVVKPSREEVMYGFNLDFYNMLKK